MGIPYDQLPERVKALIVDEQTRNPAGFTPVVVPKRTRLERDLHKEVYNELNRRRPKLWFVDSRMDKPTSQRKGVPDFVICLAGKFCAIELKVKGNKLTAEQEGELGEIMMAGGAWCLAYSTEEVIKFLDELV